MEIYNEEINDLLAPDNRRLQIHENLEVGIHLSMECDTCGCPRLIAVHAKRSGCIGRGVSTLQVWGRRLWTTVSRSFHFWNLGKVTFAFLSLSWVILLLFFQYSQHHEDGQDAFESLSGYLVRVSWRSWDAVPFCYHCYSLWSKFCNFIVWRIVNSFYQHHFYISIHVLKTRKYHQKACLSKHRYLVSALYAQLNDTLEKPIWIYIVVVLTAFFAWWVFVGITSWSTHVNTSLIWNLINSDSFSLFQIFGTLHQFNRYV